MTIITKRRQESAIFRNVKCVNNRGIYCFHEEDGSTLVTGYLKGIDESDAYLFPILGVIPEDDRDEIAEGLERAGAKEVRFSKEPKYKDPIDQLIEENKV